MNHMLRFFYKISYILVLLTMMGCNALNIAENSQGTSLVIEKVSSFLDLERKQQENETVSEAPKTLSSILAVKPQKIDLSLGFKESLRAAVGNHPSILASKQRFQIEEANIEIIKSRKDFQFSGNLYGGLSDLSESKKGAALSLNATRLISDGGMVDADIASAILASESQKYEVIASMDEKAVELAKAWVDLERFQKLNSKIRERLEVLDPLIAQLERVAKAGAGDVAQVSKAQRTVSSIRVTQADVLERLSQAEIAFIDSFGALPDGTPYDEKFVTTLVPNSIKEEMIANAPAIKSGYSGYLAAMEFLKGVQAKDKFRLAFEARATTPVVGNSHDSEEMIGLVASKTLYNGNSLKSEIERAEAQAATRLAELRAVHKRGNLVVETAVQKIQSMERVIQLAQANKENIADEIVYLKQQLIIGGSTLDSVLSAEARLYDAEAKEINFKADKNKSELEILGALGMLSSGLGLTLGD